MFPSETTAAEIINSLGLMPLEGEGGYWAPGSRSQSMNSIFFLMTSTADGFSALHKLKVTEGWQWLAGAPARMVQFSEDSELLEITLDARNSQTIVPTHVWQAARTLGEWTLVSCWCAPAFTEEIFELGDRNELSSKWPKLSHIIEEFTR